MRVFFSAFFLLLTIQVNAEQSASPLSSIRVTGHATVTAAPDLAQIDVGVETHAPQSKAAAAQSAARLSETLAALRQAVGSSGVIKTLSYTLGPEYKDHNDGTRSLTGYVADHVVRVTLTDLAKLGSVIDVGTQAGANEIRDVQFLLSNQQPVRARALREAVLAARGDAQALAEALDLKITRVSLVDDTETTGGLEKLDRMFKRSVPEPAQTPMMPGTIDITATVTLTVEVGATSR